MDTNINTIDSQYTNETIEYNDANLNSVISQLNSSIQSLKNIGTELAAITSYESTWKGKSKKTYVDLKHFLDQYQKDYLSSLKKLKKTATGLETLLGDIPNAKVIKEIDNA